MTIALTWLAHAPTSHDHAAATLALRGTLADPALAAALSPHTATLLAALDAAPLPREAFFEQLVPMSLHSDTPRLLVEATLRKLTSNRLPTDRVEPIISALTQLRAAAQRAQPRLLDDLALRCGPLREQWEARGPGLLMLVGRQTEPELIVESATILLVHPVRGGGGEAHMAHNSVRFEALLANRRADLPEIVQLAWLLAQLNQDLPRFREALPSALPAHVFRLALVPPVLEAAAELELVPTLERALPAALEHWGLADDAPTQAALLADWWRTYRATRPAWSVALAALAAMGGDTAQK